MKLKIISDGTAIGTKIVNAETGEELSRVTGIEWEISVSSPARAVVRMVNIPVELTGDFEVEQFDLKE